MNIFIITNHCRTNDIFLAFYTSETNGLTNVVTNLYEYYQKCFTEMYVIFGVFSG